MSCAILKRLSGAGRRLDRATLDGTIRTRDAFLARGHEMNPSFEFEAYRAAPDA